MDRCTQYQSQMLDYVYDLLDGDVVRDLALHLELCHDCQAALREARGQQQLLAAAARLEFPSVCFQLPQETPGPAETVPAHHEPAPPPVLLPVRPRLLPPARPRRLAWRAWLSAAAVLLALSVPAWLRWDYLAARRDLDAHESAEARVRHDREEVTEKLLRLDRDEEEKTRAVEEEVLQKERSVTVIGPPAIRSGTPNDYQIETRDGRSAPVPTRLEARVLDKANNRVLYEKKDRESRDIHHLTLPPTLPVGPDAQVVLEVTARDAEGGESQLRADFPLTAPVYLTHLATEKPVYQPGETVRFRALTLERFSLTPAKEPLALRFTLATPGVVFEVPHADPRRPAETLALNAGAPFRLGWGRFAPEGKEQDESLRGLAGGEWEVPAGCPPGEYTLTVSEDHGRFPPQRRKFLVHHGQRSHLLKELDFTRPSYRPGEAVVALCHAAGNDGTPFAHRAVTATVKVDGKTYDADGLPGGPLRLGTDADGKVQVHFKLPEAIAKGRTSLEVAFHDGRQAESVFRHVPLVLKTLEVEFYPEGGYLVPDGPNRVYFQARTPQGRPAELKGRLFDDLGDEVARVETFHLGRAGSVSNGLSVAHASGSSKPAQGAGQGRGVFTLTPHRGRTYRLKVDTPSGVEVANTLQAEELGKVALRVLSPVTTAHEPIEVRVRSAGADRKLRVAAYCRGRLLDYQRVEAKAEQEETVRLSPAQGVGGVYRVTVFEEVDGTPGRLEPRAERLVFRRHRDRLNLSVMADKEAYLPGEKATLTLTSRGEDQEPISSVAMLAVVDRAALALADERSARSMPTHFYLTSEVRGAEDLEDADFLLTADPAAERALDLLLGTQGWRRFVERPPAEASTLSTALAAGPGPVEVPRVVDNQGDQRAALGRKLVDARQKARDDFGAEREQLLGRQSRLDEQMRETRLSPGYLAARARVTWHEDLVAAVHALFPLAGLLLVIAAAVLLGRGLTLPARRAVPHFSAAAACASLLMVLGVVAFSDRPAPDEDAGQRAETQAPPKEVEEVGKQTESQREVAAAPRAKRQHSFEEKPGERPDGRAIEEQSPVKKADGTTSQPPPVSTDAVPSPIAPLAPAPPGARPPGSPIPPTSPMTPKPFGPYGADAGQGDDRKPPPPLGGGPGFGGLGGRGGFPGSFGGPPPVASRVQGHMITPPTPGGASADKNNGTGRVAAMELPEGEKDGAERLKELDRALGKDARAALRERGRSKGMANQRRTEGADRFAREFRYLHDEEELARAPDFTDTVCWLPALTLPGGQATVGFNLNDALTTYQVTVFGHTADGRLAAATRTLQTRKPLSVQPLAPSELTAGDRADVPVDVVNRTPKDQDVDLYFFRGPGKNDPGARPKAPDGERKSEDTGRLKLRPGEKSRLIYPLKAEPENGKATLQVEGRAPDLPADSARRDIRVVPQGFPVEGWRSGLLEGKADYSVVLRLQWVKGTLACRVEAYPSALADVQKGLDALLRQPGRNFEQVTTTGRSNVLLLDQLKAAKEPRPELEKRSRELLASTYREMEALECVDPLRQVRGGFEWFGSMATPDKALTAYGLMQLRDVARFQEVDRALLERTRRSLLSRHDRTPDGPDNALADVRDAYVVWALTEGGAEDNLTRELDALAGRARGSKDPYFLALAANSLANRGRRAEAVPLLQRAAAVQRDDGSLDAELTSVTGSRGRDLRIETTALAVLGWQRADAGRFRGSVEKAVRWLEGQRDGHGAFGSTQATILALKALAVHARGASRAAEDGELTLWVGGQQVAKLSFKAGASGPLVLNVPEPEKCLKPGANGVRLEVTGKNRLPCTLAWSYRSLEPVHDEACPVRLSTSLDRTRATEGQRVRLTVRLENTADSGQGVAVAVVGLPAGLSVPEGARQLAGYRQTSRIGSFEERGRELVLSWRGLAPRQKVEVPVDLVCRVPGEYRGPASRAYLHYDADHTAWAAPLQIHIIPKK